MKLDSIKFPKQKSVRGGWFLSYILVLIVPLLLCLLLYNYSAGIITAESKRIYGSALDQARIDLDSYLTEGDFDDSGSIKIFPVAKSTELLFLNDTDWQTFAAATGAQDSDLETVEGLVKTAEATTTGRMPRPIRPTTAKPVWPRRDGKLYAHRCKRAG